MKHKLKMYRRYLVEQELAESTIQTYMKRAEDFTAYVGRRKLTRQIVLAYKKERLEKQYKVSTVNLAIVALNKFMRFLGEETCLVEQIRSYCEKERIQKGAVFWGCGEQPVSRTAVWKMLQHIADMAGVDKRKVYPHSFRHFFALSYMKHFSNIFELADILGHSSLETTRIYTSASIEQKRERMGKLDEMQK